MQTSYLLFTLNAEIEILDDISFTIGAFCHNG